MSNCIKSIVNLIVFLCSLSICVYCYIKVYEPYGFWMRAFIIIGLFMLLSAIDAITYHILSRKYDK